MTTSSGHHRLRTLVVGGTAATALVFLAGCDSSAPGATGSTEGTTPVAQAAQAVQGQFVNVVKDIGPSVVQITTSQGLGSGIVFDTGGDIVTNDHVVAGGNSLQVTLANGKQYAAKFIGSFQPDDLAVLHITAPGLQAATFADSKNLSDGDVVMAVGNPLGLKSSVTEGIVSALGRTVSEDNGVVLPNVIQTSAAINPGNSGGALVNLDGQVVGIPTLAATDPQLGGGAAPGIGFAIPANMVHNIAIQLVNTGTVTDTNRAYLGVQVGATTSGWVLVTEVDAGGGAARAGITTGDVITAVNGTPTPDPTTLAETVAGLKPGQTVPVAVTTPDGTSQTVQVTLGQYPG
ncbi:trypsin-like peptidase domain-containing protein [Amycolatopsis sp. NBC_01488]|uniref:S1C family serine protease n=1 Tax=Amycolatopsis sp. NBC_01488 TaxID=2903563 RepID=UPI002E29EAFF|nr:trypsin-like peptidase domain-containing protein [Amycolatopsis sp. NBC_01488]